MSMRLAYSANADPQCGYSVPEPMRGDVLSETLRRAYREPIVVDETFTDLLYDLDRIAVTQR